MMTGSSATGRTTTGNALSRIAILNRGEPALRFLRTLREYNAEHGLNLQGIALFTDPDRRAPFVLEADEAVCIGTPLVRPEGGEADAPLVSAYCDATRIYRLLAEHRCDAVWPGWGFASEDSRFVAGLEERGITFIGPPSDAMIRLGDKIESKVLADESGVPMAPWATIPEALVAAPEATALEALAEPIGYPLMVKASAGGGGRGIRRVKAASELAGSVEAVASEVAKVFGQGGVFMERCVTGARHIEVQLVVGADGRAKALGTRDCSVQRRNQKVIEEAPATIVPDDKLRQICDSAERLAEIAGYRGVGTAEFLYQPDSQLISFLEVNSRLQVEHTLTEMCTGVDLVAAQLDIARGLPWHPNGTPPKERGAAIEVRLNAEDAEAGFRPAPGAVSLFRVPAGPGIRVDSGIVEGSVIPPDFDSMVAKVIAWAPTRQAALARCERALREMAVVVEDGTTNQGFLLSLLHHPALRDRELHTSWLDQAVERGELNEPAWAFESLIAAGIVEYRLERRDRIRRFFAQVQDGIPREVPAPEGVSFEFRLRNTPHRVEVFDLGRDHWAVQVDGGPLYSVQFEVLGRHDAVMHIEGHAERRHVLHSWGKSGTRVEIDGCVHCVDRASGGIVRTASPAMVVHVAVKEGDQVAVGDPLVTLEAMKMEMAITAPEAGVVRAVLCQANRSVGAGEALLRIDPEAPDGAEEAAPTEAPSLATTPAAPPRWAALFDAEGHANIARLDELDGAAASAVVASAVEAVRSLLLGYDVPATWKEQLVSLIDATGFSKLQKPERWKPITSLLEEFGAIESLFDRNFLPLPEGSVAISAELAYFDFCRRYHDGSDAMADALLPVLQRALQAYGVEELDASDELRLALWRLTTAHRHGELRHRFVSALLRILMSIHAAGARWEERGPLRQMLDRVGQVASERHPAVADNARQAIYDLFQRPRLDAERAAREAEYLRVLAGDVEATGAVLSRIYPLSQLAHDPEIHAWKLSDRATVLLVAAAHDGSVDLRTLREPPVPPAERVVEVFATTNEALEIAWPPFEVSRVTINAPESEHRAQTWVPGPDGWTTDDRLSGVHPEAAERIELNRLEAFELHPLQTPEGIFAWRAVARDNARDERILAYVDILPHQLRPGGDRTPHDQLLHAIERAYFESVRVIRGAQARRTSKTRLRGNRISFYVHGPIRLGPKAVAKLSQRLEPHSRQLGLEKVVLRAPRQSSADGQDTVWREIVVSTPGRHRLEVSMHPASRKPIEPMTPYRLSVQRARRLGVTYPYEIIQMLRGPGAGKAPHPDLQKGRFIEYDLDVTGLLNPTDRPAGENTSGVVVGVVTHETAKHPEGMSRVWIGSDPTKAMGALSEPECRRIIAAIDLAQLRQWPVEWLPVSAGARIAMDSGTENLDWTARVLRRIVEFTQAGGTIHTLVAGVNVGAQSYWNAEASMLMHTRGVLIMTPGGSMVLTGKRALEYSGGVAAEDEQGIGGFERIMGPNGQSQYFADDLGSAYAILMEHYRFTYRVTGERVVRRHQTTDAESRSIAAADYRSDTDESFTTVGEVFSHEANPGRKRPFAIRAVMRALIDRDGGQLERWPTMRHAETAVVWDAHIGGHAVSLLGVESRNLPRRGRVPMDGPDTWSGGTLFPQGSKKLARALNAASGNRPAVVLANLSGFDGSPESLRKLQLEWGAEIGRAVVNFEGPIIFVVVGRYHGGAYVVFSKALNPRLRALAVEGSFASVIGGAPAAAVVLPRVVKRRTEADPRVLAARQALAEALPTQRPRLRDHYDAVYSDVLLEHQGALAKEFDAIHSVQRAVDVGSLDRIISAEELRPAIIEELSRQSPWH